MSAQPLPRTLANGHTTTPADTRHQIYRAPRKLKAVMVRWLSVYNEDNADRTCIVYVTRAGRNSKVANVTLDADGGSARVIDRDEELVLSPDDSISIEVDAPNVVEYTLVGIEVPE